MSVGIIAEAFAGLANRMIPLVGTISRLLSFYMDFLLTAAIKHNTMVCEKPKSRK